MTEDVFAALATEIDDRTSIVELRRAAKRVVAELGAERKLHEESRGLINELANALFAAARRSGHVPE